MRFTCPTCGAGYRVEDERIPDEGARLDCGGCDTRLVLRHDQPVIVAPPSRGLLEDINDELSLGLTATFTLADLEVLPAEGKTEAALLWHLTVSNGDSLMLTEAELGARIATGAVDANTMVWRPGFEAWIPLHRDALAADVLKRSGPWSTGSITSIYEAAQVDASQSDRAETLPERAQEVLAQLAGRPTVPPTALPSDVAPHIEDHLGEAPEVVIANEGLLRRGGGGSPVAVAVRRNQRRLLFMAVGIPIVILVMWRVVTWPQAKGRNVREVSSATQSGKGSSGVAQREAERQRRQRMLLQQGSFRLSTDQKNEVLTREFDALKACGFGQKGDALVRLRIKPNGAPFDIRVAGVSGGVAKCVRQTIARWRFPRFTGPADEMSFPLPSD